MENQTHHNSGRTDSKQARPASIIKKLILPIIVVVVAVVAYFLMKRKTTTTGAYPHDIRTESLNCTKEGQAYDKVWELKPSSRRVDITAIFEGTSSVQSVAIKYTMNFESAERADTARHTASVTIAQSLQDAGFNFNSFDNKMSVIDSTIYIDLIAKREELNTKSAPFFLIEKTASGSDLPITLQDYRNNYVKQGFVCKATTDK